MEADWKRVLPKLLFFLFYLILFLLILYLWVRRMPL